MASQNRLAIAFLLTWKKIARSRVNTVLFLGYFLFLAYLWLRDSYEFSFRFFLFSFPYLFLLVSQGMVKDEIDDGSLENVFFLDGRFKDYLIKKNLFLGGLGVIVSLAAFAVFASYGVAIHELSTVQTCQFLIGIVVGLYYLCLGLLLSFFIRGGANALIVIIGQIMVFVGFIATVTQSGGLLTFLDTGNLPNLLSKIEFMGLVIILPNAAIGEKFFLYVIEVGILCVLFFILQRMKIRRVELVRK